MSTTYYQLMGVLSDISEKSENKTVQDTISGILSCIESLSHLDDMAITSNSADSEENTLQEDIQRGRNMVKDEIWNLLSKISEIENHLYEDSLKKLSPYF